jgi:hypothetical protein
MFRPQRSAAAAGALVSSAEPGRENRVGRNSPRAGATISAGWHWHHVRDDPHDHASITGQRVVWRSNGRRPLPRRLECGHTLAPDSPPPERRRYPSGAATAVWTASHPGAGAWPESTGDHRRRLHKADSGGSGPAACPRGAPSCWDPCQRGWHRCRHRNPRPLRRFGAAAETGRRRLVALPGSPTPRPTGARPPRS